MMTALRSIAALMLLSVASVSSDSVCVVLSVEEFNPLLESAVTNCTDSTCSVDFAEFPASKQLESDCSNLTDATFVQQSESTTCAGKTVEAKNIPYCQTKECDGDALKKAQEDVVESVNKVYSDIGLDCSVTIETAGSLSHGVTMVLMAVMGLAVFFG
ncbi:expressed unknown protein [Seminavis robusta]|uniref:Uncharacterized protein n=1 Tax=Seminavis robusta TaxID=568900 RepID=A0A9N8EBN1_9STRA|nr:expressed unknown protein [Seminavis robusta]|eukprot:Sro888_g216460.1 n/a (158) ;mRNA; r:25368-25953